jgi:hypothetical protein
MLSSLLVAFAAVAAQEISDYPTPTPTDNYPFPTTTYFPTNYPQPPPTWYPTPTPDPSWYPTPTPGPTTTGGWGYPLPTAGACTVSAAVFSTPVTFQSLSRSDIFALLAPKMSKEQQAFGKISKAINPTVKATISYNYRYTSLDDSIRGLIHIFEHFYSGFKSLEQTCSDGDFYNISIKYTIEVGRVAKTIE